MNSIHPGGIKGTAMSLMFEPKDPVEAAQRSLANMSPLGRHGTTDDVSSVIAFLLSDERSWITSREFVIDGGATLHP